MFKTFSVAAAITLMASASFAGSLVTTEPVVETPVFVPQGSGIGAPVIVGGVLAAVAVAALIANDDDDETAATPDSD